MAAILEVAPAETSKASSECSLALATLPDLPNELLLTIFHDLDNQTLFNLGLICRRMNTVALGYFFSRNDIQDPGGGYFLPNRLDLPIQIIPALRSALFVHDLQNFEFVLNPRGEIMREEVTDLCVLAARLRSMQRFKLSFRNMDHHSFLLADMQTLVAGGVWYKSVTRLLDTVLAKSCNVFEVEGGTRFSELYYIIPTPCPGMFFLAKLVLLLSHLILLFLKVHEQQIEINKENRLSRPGTVLTPLQHILTFKQKASSILQTPRIVMKGVKTNEPLQLHEGNASEFNSSHTQTTNMDGAETGLTQVSQQAITPPPGHQNPNLTEAQIHSDMLLRFPFTKWAVSSLNAASSTLTKLSLKMTVEANVTWKTFSRRLSLPLLKTFSLSSHTFVRVKVPEFVDIEIFLENHPSIQDLSLYGVQFPPSSEAIPRPAFHNLVRFNAHPSYVAWFFKSAQLNVMALPNLECVSISSENYADGPRLSDYTHFEPALEAIAEFSRNIDLAFTFNCRGGIGFWFRTHVLEGQGQGSSIFSQLTNISTLTLHDLWGHYTPRMMAIFPEWLRLFPSLRHLRLDTEGVINVMRLTDAEFVSSIAMLCPGLETMVVNQGSIIDLGQIRRNRKDASSRAGR